MTCSGTCGNIWAVAPGNYTIKIPTHVVGAFESEKVDVQACLALLGATLVILMIFDGCLRICTNINSKSRWFFIHAFGNAIIVTATAPILYRGYMNPIPFISQDNVRYDASTAIADGA